MRKLLALLIAIPLMAQMPSKLKVRELKIKGTNAYWKADTINVGHINITSQSVPRMITFTADDGFLSDSTHLIPWGRDHGVTWTLFIIPTYIVNPPASPYPHMGKTALQYVGQYADIQAHAEHGLVTHNFTEEMLDSLFTFTLDSLRSWGFNPRFFAFPLGEYNDMILAKTQEYFEGAVLTHWYNWTYNRPGTNPYMLVRIGFEEFIENNEVDSLWEIMDSVAKYGGWMIIMEHHVEDADTAIYTTVLDSALAKGLTPVSLSEGFDRFYQFKTKSFIVSNFDSTSGFTALQYRIGQLRLGELSQGQMVIWASDKYFKKGGSTFFVCTGSWWQDGVGGNKEGWKLPASEWPIDMDKALVWWAGVQNMLAQKSFRDMADTFNWSVVNVIDYELWGNGIAAVKNIYTPYPYNGGANITSDVRDELKLQEFTVVMLERHEPDANNNRTLIQVYDGWNYGWKIVLDPANEQLHYDVVVDNGGVREVKEKYFNYVPPDSMYFISMRVKADAGAGTVEIKFGINDRAYDDNLYSGLTSPQILYSATNTKLEIFRYSCYASVGFFAIYPSFLTDTEITNMYNTLKDFIGF